MAKVVLYTTQQCPFCKAAKELLKQRQIPYDEIDVDKEDDSKWDALCKKSGMKTVPQIFFGDSLIGGYTELSHLDKKNALSSLK